MTPTPWLSILIPVYNVEPYLKECLDSIVQQIDSGIEIIALDDCSTDNSYSVLCEYAKTFPITILKHDVNRGLSAARNSMLNAATATYVWFLDSDDAIHQGAITSLHSIVKQYAPDLVMCDFSVWREQQKSKHRLRGENHVASFAGTPHQLHHNPIALFDGIYRGNNLHIWSKISKRELWRNDLRFPEGRNMEDMVITPRLALRVNSYYYQPTPWVAYRQRQGSILATANQKKIDDSFCANDGVLDLWLKKYPDLPHSTRFLFAYFCVKTHIGAMRDLRSLHKSNQPNVNSYREGFFKQVQWSKTQLYWQYLKRGWLLRLLRFIREH